MMRYPILAALLALAGIVGQATAQGISLPSTNDAQAAMARADAALAAAQAAQTAVTTETSARATALATMQASIPQPATATPPGVADSGAIGTQTTFYALANHTHASKARKGRLLVPVVSGATYADVTFSTAFTSGVTPLCAVTAETTSGDTTVVNAQIDGVPTATGMRIRVTRTAVTAVALLGLSVLSVPTQTATYTHFICLEP